MTPAKRIILSGLPGSGKTTLCQSIIHRANTVGLDFKGLISPPVMLDNVKVGIDVVDLSTNTRHNLASLSRYSTSGLMTKRWAFNEDIIEWGNSVIKNSLPCVQLMIDELGPLEFERDSGWMEGIAAVDQGEYQTAMIVIRPKFLKLATRRWGDSMIFTIDQPDQVSAISELILSEILQ